MVDDHKLVRNLVVRILENAGLAVIAVETGMAAIELIRERPEGIGCVLQDLSMPNMRGEEVIARMHEINPHLPIVAFSAEDIDSAAERLSGLNLAGYVQKPFEVSAMVELLLRLSAKAPTTGDKRP